MRVAIDRKLDLMPSVLIDTIILARTWIDTQGAQ